MQNNNCARTSRFFVHFFAVPAQLGREMTKILSFLENGNGKSIKFYNPYLKSGAIPSFSSDQNSLLLSDRENWDNREKVSMDATSIFQ